MLNDVPKLRRLVSKDLAAIAVKHGFEKHGKYFRKYNENSISVLRAAFEKRVLGQAYGLGVLIEIGVSYPCVPTWYGLRPVESKGGRLMPENVDCTFRHFLHGTMDLPPREWKTDFWDIWSAEDWSNELPRLQSLFRDSAIPWFERYDDLSIAVRDLLSMEENRRATWGIGLNGSIIRNWNALFIALELGELKVAHHCVDTLCSLPYAPEFRIQNPVLLEIKAKL